jgi:transposase-like protein
MLAGPLPSEAAGKFVEREPNPVGCGQVVDLLVSTRRDASAVRQFFGCALRFAASPVEVVTDRAPVYPRVLDDLLPAARHVTEQYANNVIEADHGRLKGRLQTMRGLKTLRSTRVIATGHAFVHNLRHGHYAITTEQAPHHLLPQRSPNSRTVCEPGH